MIITTRIAETLAIDDIPKFTFTDDPINKVVSVTVVGSGNIPKRFSFILWKGATYTAAGDYTQAAITTAVTAYLNTIKVNS